MTLSNLSAITIPFKPSRHYRLLLIGMHLLGILVLWRANLPLMLQAAMSGLLVLHAWRVRGRRLPHPEIRALSHRESEWTVHATDGSTRTFPRMQVRLDGGFFWHLCLEDETSCLRLLVFVDSLDRDMRWRLRFVANIS